MGLFLSPCGLGGAAPSQAPGVRCDLTVSQSSHLVLPSLGSEMGIGPNLSQLLKIQSQNIFRFIKIHPVSLPEKYYQQLTVTKFKRIRKLGDRSREEKRDAEADKHKHH